ncbi:hypothetical protein AVEN_213039-1, partial [Araneus ventricosus]
MAEEPVVFTKWQTDERFSNELFTAVGLAARSFPGFIPTETQMWAVSLKSPPG